MAYMIVAVSLTCVGLSLKLMTMKSALTKAKLLLAQEREDAQLALTKLDDLQIKADKRVKELKGRINELLEESIEYSKPGDLRFSLNSMLTDEDS